MTQADITTPSVNNVKGSTGSSANRSSAIYAPITLADAIKQHQSFEVASFHTPGHKGRPLEATVTQLSAMQPVWQADLTELPGLDELSNPQGVLANIEARASRLWAAAESIISVNGASAGISACMLALAGRGNSVLVPRNAHRSVMNGLILSGLMPIWYEPEWNEQWQMWGESSAETITQSIEQALAKENVRLAGVVLVSPTYAGTVSDVERIAQTCHRHGLPLVVDEAHGAHFVFDSETAREQTTGSDVSLALVLEKPPGSAAILVAPTCNTVSTEAGRKSYKESSALPGVSINSSDITSEVANFVSAIQLGADLVVHSLHKVAPALTQTGLVHIGRKSLIDSQSVRAAMNLLQSSSPSYLLMLSIEQALSSMESSQGEVAFNKISALSKRLSQAVSNIVGLRISTKDRLNHTSHVSISNDHASTKHLPQAISNTGGLRISTKDRLKDPAHILISSDYASADQLAQALIDWGIYPETVLGTGVLFLLGYGSTVEDVEQLIAALREVTPQLQKEASPSGLATNSSKPFPISQVVSPRNAYFACTETLSPENAIGKISAEMIAPCPPGTMVLVPGQRIPAQIKELKIGRLIKCFSDDVVLD